MLHLYSISDGPSITPSWALRIAAKLCVAYIIVDEDDRAPALSEIAEIVLETVAEG